MTLLFIAPSLRPDPWIRQFKRVAPDLEICVWPQVADSDKIAMALSWKHPAGALKNFANLKAIASLGAGVDHLFKDPDLPAHLPLTRIVDHSMAQSMREYVALAALQHCRQLDQYTRDQQLHRWKPRLPLLPAHTPVGILGMGQLGLAVAQTLLQLGFAVAGWSRSLKTIEGVQSFVGPSGLEEMLAQSRILVCLLPLTTETRGILNAQTFVQLPRGAYLIQAARGEHLVEPDLLAALDDGRLSGACLDVFEEEPLPAEHLFWDHPRIRITPHVSSLTNPKKVVPQLVANYRRLLNGEPLRHCIDPVRRY